jgi:hypothetical protein
MRRSTLYIGVVSLALTTRLACLVSELSYWQTPVPQQEPIPLEDIGDLQAEADRLEQERIKRIVKKGK